VRNLPARLKHSQWAQIPRRDALFVLRDTTFVLAHLKNPPETFITDRLVILDLVEMKKTHALDANVKQALEFLVGGTCRSLNAAAIMALGGKDNTNEAQIKSLKRRFAGLGYHRLLATVRDSGTSTVEQAKILDLKKRAKAALEEAEELYNELSILENSADCFGTGALIDDLANIVDQYTDFNLDTVELLTQGMACATSKLIGNSWSTGDSAHDKFGNELYSPKLTIVIECDPSVPHSLKDLTTRGPGLSTIGQGTTILIRDSVPIDEVKKQLNIQEWIRANDKRRHQARA
jgi:hypothetical protein